MTARPAFGAGFDDWLRHVVAQVTGGAGPATFRRLAGHASARTYWRGTWDAGRSVVVMVLPPDAPPDEIGRAGQPLGPAPFVDVQSYLQRIGVRVPAILGWNQAEGWVVLEDLGDDMMVSRLAAGASPGPLYRAAIDQLAAMRVAAEAHPDPDCVAFRRCYDRDLYAWELEHFLEWVLTADRRATLSSAEDAVVARHFDAIADRLAGEPLGFTHRDYQSRNLMLLPGDRQVVIDFQDALLGPRHYDLVALLRDSYVRLDQRFITEMVRHYLQACQAAGGAAPPEGPFRELFDLLTVQRKLKDAGRFVYLDRVKGNPDFLKFVPVALDYVRQAFSRLPALAELQAVLGRYVAELAC